MKHYDLEIADIIATQLDQWAANLGVSVEQLLQVKIGEWFSPEHSLPFRAAPSLAPERPLVSDEEQSANMAKSFRTYLAVAGQLKCDTCTQKLTLTDVNAGCCSKCEAPLA